MGVDHLRLVMGTSMGCMHSWMWGEAYPDEMDALIPLACLPVEVAGRNRLWRKMIIDEIRQDPDFREHPLPVASNGGTDSMSKSKRRPKRGQS